MKGCEDMQVNLKNLVSMTEANQNFSTVAKLVDENGAAVILKNNSPRYIILDYRKIEEDSVAENEAVEEVAANILRKQMKDFEELAK